MKARWFFLCMALVGASLTQAAPPDADGQDWGRLRRDVDAEARRPGGNDDFAARRQAIRERARARYNAADSNGDGSLSREEMARLRPALARHFDQIDTNGDGLASEQEIINALRRLQQMRREGAGRALPPGSARDPRDNQ